MSVQKEFLELLKDLKSFQNSSFAGIGLILYSSLENLEFTPMKNNSIIHDKVLKGEDELLSFFKDSSLQSSYFHDGFHLINERFELTHLSVYISPKIEKEISIPDVYGSRYRTALYSSLHTGILSTGIIGKSYGIYLFQNGSVSHIY